MAALRQRAARFGCGGEVDPVAGLGAGAGQADREHGLADPGWSDQQDVGALVDEPQGGQLADQGLVDAGLGGEVEVGQPPGCGQAGEPEPGGEPAFLGRGDLDGEQRLEGLDQRELADAGLVEQSR